MGALIIQFNHYILSQLMLDAEVPFLHGRRFHVARHRVLILRLYFLGIEAQKQGLCRPEIGSDIQTRQVVRDGIGPAAARVAPFP